MMIERTVVNQTDFVYLCILRTIYLLQLFPHNVDTKGLREVIDDAATIYLKKERRLGRRL